MAPPHQHQTKPETAEPMVTVTYLGPSGRVIYGNYHFEHGQPVVVPLRVLEEIRAALPGHTFSVQ